MGSIYEPLPDPWMGLFCKRCGRLATDCPHPYSLSTMMRPEEAVRVRARYNLGKELNPDHDTTDYFTETP